MTDQPRAVWLTREQRDLLTQVLIYLPNHHGDQLREVIRAWDAAPADPVEAAARKLEELHGIGSSLDKARALLRALGGFAPTPPGNPNA